ncbi:hypothetical protein RUM43_012850 [Polyplax serrata]|uniref:Uncharacterized protein n=1 Tax=Polyplax serrata TaxID=468196 RepID=A0AAN8S7B3_POLSC
MHEPEEKADPEANEQRYLELNSLKVDIQCVQYVLLQPSTIPQEISPTTSLIRKTTQRPAIDAEELSMSYFCLTVLDSVLTTKLLTEYCAVWKNDRKFRTLHQESNRSLENGIRKLRHKLPNAHGATKRVLT